MISLMQDESNGDGDGQCLSHSDHWHGLNGDDQLDFGAAPGPAGPLGKRMALLANTIEQEIIPRLMHAHRDPALRTSLRIVPGLHVLKEDIAQFAKLVLSHDDAVAPAFIHAMRSRGITVEMVYVELLAPVARHLGALWEEDLCDGVDLTIALGRLQQFLRELSPAFCHSADRPVTGRRLLLLPGPGEQRTFGLVVVAEFFHRAGWDITFGLEKSASDPVAAVKRDWFDVVGFSRAGALHTEALAERIQAVRRAAINRQLVIMVGDPVLVVRSDYAARVKADIVADDSQQAPVLAEALVSSRSKSDRSIPQLVIVPARK